MPFVTIPQSPIYYQITFDDILNGEVDVSKMYTPNSTNTRTYFKNELKQSFLDNFDFSAMIASLEAFNTKYADLFEVKRETLYEKFYIPKKNGGRREINAPVVMLKNALYDLKDIFEKQMQATYHTSAFAYVKGRCTVDSIKKHQQNESKWFAKFDFSDFFGSTTEDFVIKMFSMIFPFNEITKTPRGLCALRKALSLCFLKGGLPQGTPISPIITNIMMIPIDHKFYNELRKMDKHYIYTRYADDILISSRVDFDHKEIESFLVGVLNNVSAPFSINSEKTRYGSSAGSNWNLGVILNKDNKITVGYRAKREFKAICCSYICDKLSGVNWELVEVQRLAGKLSYYRMIEKEYFNYVIFHLNKKFKTNIETLIKADLR